MAGGDSKTPLLDVRNLTRRFGGLKAIDDLSFQVRPNTIHGLIGPNGAGKTTTFYMISGFYAPTSGHILYLGRDVAAWRTSGRRACAPSHTSSPGTRPTTCKSSARGICKAARAWFEVVFTLDELFAE